MLPHPRVVQVRRFVEGVLLVLVFRCVVVVLVHMVGVLWVYVLEVMLRMMLVSMRLVDGVWMHLLFASPNCGSADGR